MDPVARAASLPAHVVGAVASALWAAWLRVDGSLAWLMGMDESKYQWALLRHEAMQIRVRDSRARPPRLAAAASPGHPGITPAASSTPPHAHARQRPHPVAPSPRARPARVVPAVESGLPGAG
jgi:hypothetical protein